MLEPQPRDTTKMQDIRFVNYEPRDSAWVSPRVEIWTEGKLIFAEDYDQIEVDPPLSDALFDPSKWKAAKHWTVKQ
jgi:glucan biosynthesis protein